VARQPTFAVLRERAVGDRLAAMSAGPKPPPAPRLRAIREAWLGRAVERLEADPAIGAAGLVGSLGRGDADDWSDVDLLIVVPDRQVDNYADATQLPGSEQVIWSIDARHNAPRGAGMSLQALMALMAHVTPEMTLRYSTLASPTLRAAYDEAIGKLRRKIPVAPAGRPQYPSAFPGCRASS
jgi:hypothetical protein